jgi:hypothetical protein
MNFLDDMKKVTKRARLDGDIRIRERAKQNFPEAVIHIKNAIEEEASKGNDYTFIDSTWYQCIDAYTYCNQQLSAEFPGFEFKLNKETGDLGVFWND